MKTLLLIILLSATGLTCLAQTPVQLTKEDSIRIETEVKIAVQKLKDSLKESDRGMEYLTELLYEFAADTFKIEERQRLRLEIDYTTNGIVASTLEANREYDRLLNKYYLRLLDSLEEPDKKILLQSQRNWIKFRDSELELNGLLMNDYYSGSGTIQRVIAASRVLELTKSRVIEIYHYLSRKAE